MKLLLLATILLSGSIAFGLSRQGHQVDSCFQPPDSFTPPAAPPCQGQVDLMLAQLCAMEYQLRMSQIETKRCNDLEAAAEQNEEDLNDCLESYNNCMSGGNYTPEQCQFMADNCASSAAHVWNASVQYANSYADARGAAAADAYEECMANACVEE